MQHFQLLNIAHPSSSQYDNLSKVFSLRFPLAAQAYIPLEQRLPKMHINILGKIATLSIYFPIHLNWLFLNQFFEIISI